MVLVNHLWGSRVYNVRRDRSGLGLLFGVYIQLRVGKLLLPVSYTHLTLPTNREV